MRTYNRVFLIGNCAAEPVLAETQKGSPYLYFPIAIEKSYSNSESEKNEVEFHKVVMWKEHSEKLKNLIRKGTRLFVTGKITNHKYESNNETKYVTEIHANQIEVLSFKGQEKPELKQEEINLTETSSKKKLATV